MNKDEKRNKGKTSRKSKLENLKKKDTKHREFSIVGYFQRISFKVCIGLLIPIVLMAIYGVISYQKSEDAIVQNYEVSVGDTLDSVSEFLDFGLNIVKQKSIEMQLDNNMKKYYTSYGTENAIDKVRVLDEVTQSLTVAKSTNSFISAIHIFGENGNGMSTDAANLDNMYQEFVKSELGQKFDDKSVVYLWLGEHHEIDEMLSSDGTSYGTDQYALSLVRKKNDRSGFIIIDIANQQIFDMFAKFDMGEDSIIGFVTGDGREVLLNTDQTNVFQNLSYYQDGLLSEETSGSSYETYNEDEYLYLYSKLEDIDAVVCALVPKDQILKQVRGIKVLNVAFITVACILAFLTVLLIAGGISKAISSFKKAIEKASEGDLTTKFDTNRKDEFLSLAQGVTGMLSNMRQLIGQVQEVGGKLNNSSKGVSNTSENLLIATKDISQTMDNAQQGIIQQANDTEQCLQLMTKLSDQIGQVNGSTYEIEHIANSTRDIIKEGNVIIEELSNKSEDTSKITDNIIQKIEESEARSSYIGGFVNLINEISEQTNLLSLNASIEAARAGEYGRGFAVVADEIRKLADQSKQAANEIQSIVKEIQKDTKDTVQTAKEAEDIVVSQMKSLDQTVMVFNKINNRVEELVNHLNDITIGIKGIETAKDETLMAIENISAVSEETAAASEEITATASNQIESVEELRTAALSLAEDAEELEDSIKIFKIE